MAISVSGELVPAGDFPVVLDTNIKGGLRVVVSKTVRNAIPSQRRVAGMVVRTSDTGEQWRLLPSPWAGTDADWEPDLAGGYVLSGVSFGGAPATLLRPDGTELSFASDCAFGVRGSCLLTTSTESSFVVRDALIRTAGGTLVLVQQTQSVTLSGGTPWIFTYDVSGSFLRLVVTGEVGKNVRAKVDIHIHKLPFT